MTIEQPDTIYMITMNQDGAVTGPNPVPLVSERMAGLIIPHAIINKAPDEPHCEPLGERLQACTDFTYRPHLIFWTQRDEMVDGAVHQLLRTTLLLKLDDPMNRGAAAGSWFGQLWHMHHPNVPLNALWEATKGFGPTARFALCVTETPEDEALHTNVARVFFGARPMVPGNAGAK